MAMISKTKTKNRALYHAHVLKYSAAKIHSFLFNGLYFKHPLTVCETTFVIFFKSKCYVKKSTQLFIIFCHERLYCIHLKWLYYCHYVEKSKY